MQVLFFKGGEGSGNHGHGGRPGKVGGSAPHEAPSSSADISSLDQAHAYWKKHFETGSPHHVDCKYGKRRYQFSVTFQRNHAYTSDSMQVSVDDYRSFDIDRAQTMDRIWDVLRHPHVVTDSRASRAKVFDREIVVSSQYGRVVLEPVPSEEDLANNRVSHFNFVSWHAIGRHRYETAAEEARRAHTTPASLKKSEPERNKAIHDGMAYSSRTPSPARVSRSPASEGIPFSWFPHICGLHNRNPFGSDGGPGALSKSHDTDYSNLVKAGIPEGSRWITIHPNGPSSKGQPVLIQPQPDGSAHVIGGAGGKLNYLKIRHVRKESEYQKEAAARKQDKAAQKKDQRTKDKAAGLTESKKAARDQVRAQQRNHEAEFIGKVAEAMGWDKSDLEFPEKDYEHLSDTTVNKLRNNHHRDLMKRAADAVNLQRQRLVADAGSRTDAGIDTVPLESQDPDTLSVQDLAPISQSTGGLGFSADYKDRAEAAGLKDEELSAETGKARASKSAQLTEGQRKAAITRGETAKLVKAELTEIREPIIDAGASLVDAKTAVELLKAQKQLKDIQKKARDAGGEIDRATSEPKAYVLEYTADPDLDAKVADELDNDLRTVQTRAFLSKVQELAGPKGMDSLGNHIGVGAYNSVNSLALATGGDALVDRSVVDVLGIAGAAQVLARRLHTDLSPDEISKVTDGVQDFHLHHYTKASQEALTQAQDLMASVKDIELGDAASGSDLHVAQELNSRRRGAIRDAQKILGQTLGEMEGNAALVLALKQGKKDQFQVSLGKTGIESAIRQARAIGLQRVDYEISHAGGDAFLTVNGAGLDRLSKPVNRADLAQVKRNLDIISGGQDEEDWLPKGVARRPDLALNVKPGVAPRLAEPFEPGEDLHQSLRDYIGGRAADGDSPADIVADVQSGDFMRKVGPERMEEYRAALDEIAPSRDRTGRCSALKRCRTGSSNTRMTSRRRGTAAIGRQSTGRSSTSMKNRSTRCIAPWRIRRKGPPPTSRSGNWTPMISGHCGPSSTSILRKKARMPLACAPMWKITRVMNRSATRPTCSEKPRPIRNGHRGSRSATSWPAKPMPPR